MSQTNKRFQCQECGEPLSNVIDSRSRNGQFRLGTYSCHNVHRQRTLEIPFAAPSPDCVGDDNGTEHVLKQVLRQASNRMLTDELNARLRSDAPA